MPKISVVVNTWNEEENIKRCLESVRQLADEIVVVDMYSKDRTAAIAKKLGAKVFFYKYMSYADPAKNFAFRQAQGDWILSLDADEEISPLLAKRLQDLAQNPEEVTYFRLPRKNIIFGKWIKHSRWWPDYNIRFFKKGAVRWSEKVHSVPLTRGTGKDFEAKEANAIIHYHYQSISQYLERLNRYTKIQSRELINSGYRFSWPDIIKKPMGEFLSRFFAGEGYKDGLHGLVLALLQAFSELTKYLKVWEKEKFIDQDINNYHEYFEENINDYLHWQGKSSSLIRKIRLKIKKKI
ncbi:glycosyltransferase family 2 protein [Patescibacteria group bacterium]|nr:glycosyltransferase family 2 protein [Patescibacteria group bacterium]